MKKLLNLTLCMLTTILYSTPVYADVKIGEEFGFGNITSLGQAVNKLVVPGFSFATSLVVIYFLYGAYKFLASGGDKEQIAAGRQMITHSIIGFMILIFSFLIIQFLFSALFETRIQFII